MIHIVNARILILAMPLESIDIMLMTLVFLCILHIIGMFVVVCCVVITTNSVVTIMIIIITLITILPPPAPWGW